MLNKKMNLFDSYRSGEIVWKHTKLRYDGADNLSSSIWFLYWK